MNVLSLFDGISCGQIALNRAGIKYENYYASEIDKYAIQVTQSNYPNTIQLGNIVELKTDNLPKIDLVFGGSPCQSFSNAGKGEGFDGKSGLFWEYVRVLNEVKPTYFLLENVVMKKEWENVISEALGVKPIKLNSRLVSAQNRPRLYWTNIPNLIEPNDKEIKIKDIIETDIDEKYFLSEKAVTRIENSKFGREFATINTDKTRTLIASYYKIPSDGIYFNDGNRKRKYTPTECEKLQTVPVGYTNLLSDSQRYKVLGNGWTVDAIAHIFKNIHQ
jgi:site-specific DNA-cytosine methylase